MQTGASRRTTGAPVALLHSETLTCPCKPETRQQVGGGRVLVHRAHQEGRGTVETWAPDRLCGCGSWHLTGHPHFGAVS